MYRVRCVDRKGGEKECIDGVCVNGYPYDLEHSQSSIYPVQVAAATYE